ncbi:MAG: hypothetical protein OJF51_000703 [Nitrospira sp.]|jgi:NADH:ubiquinone oxidoreductase subunit F (NADH-binding)|nr:MAG: hypothetical protein OJF51_000703 [Nitrospira sp.]
MKTLISTILIAGVGLVGGMGLSLSAAADDTTSQTQAHQLTPKFPKSDKCSTSSPCRDVVGEIVRIEENYWVKLPNGNETHMRVTPETKIESRVKVGDPIAAQLTSTGDADAIKKLKQMPTADELSIQEKKKVIEEPTTLKDMR